MITYHSYYGTPCIIIILTISTNVNREVWQHPEKSQLLLQYNQVDLGEELDRKLQYKDQHCTVTDP